MVRSPLLLTMGDPAGVGPELALKGAQWACNQGIQAAIVGSAQVLSRVATQLDLGPFATISSAQFLAELGPFDDQHGPVLIDCPIADLSGVVPGKVDAITGRVSLHWVEKAIDWAKQGLARGIVTLPIHKEAWHAAGARHPGHTELLAELCGASRHCMMLAADSIRCALVTVHVGLAEVPTLLTTESVWETISLAAESVQRMVGRPPRVTVCGLNPHAGEGGLFGNREEERIIQPAIEEARHAGLQIRGPVPPDTAFIPAIRQETDVYICMYHDQGLIPLKALAFDEAVNITLGLPIVRTSVDHGTALDLAWKGLASDQSLRSAIAMADQLAQF